MSGWDVIGKYITRQSLLHMNINTLIIYVRPGIFDDGTYGVYLSPKDNPDVEYQFRSQLKTIEEAISIANTIASTLKNMVETPIEVRKTREVRLSPKVSQLEPDDIAEKLQSHLEKQLEGFSKFKGISWVRDVPSMILSIISNPAIISICALIAFIFSLSLEVPEDFPVLGWILGGYELSSIEIAMWFPSAILIIIVLRYFQARSLAADNALVGDYVITLAVKHKWRRENFHSLFRNVETSESSGWIFTILEHFITKKLQNDPDSLTGILAKHEKNTEAQGHLERINLEDFERKIHSLIYLKKEKDYAPRYVCFSPFNFVISLRNVKDALKIELAMPEDRPSIYKQIEFSVVYYTLGMYIAFIVRFILILTALVAAIYLSLNLPFWIVIVNVIIGILGFTILFKQSYSVVMKLRGFPRNHNFYDAQSTIAVL
ncbi:hypothetical protein [Methanococcoides sp. FTZ1]|uniref:hypothetical protein n=1 Tax=Methanococcoides sp. FTZ1 TaxID=3439061 RepID=UPI003F876D65